MICNIPRLRTAERLLVKAPKIRRSIGRDGSRIVSIEASCRCLVDVLIASVNLKYGNNVSNASLLFQVLGYLSYFCCL
jgi:hypothetical protein